jgi:hypothetical protein
MMVLRPVRFFQRGDQLKNEASYPAPGVLLICIIYKQQETIDSWKRDTQNRTCKGSHVEAILRIEERFGWEIKLMKLLRGMY